MKSTRPALGALCVVIFGAFMMDVVDGSTTVSYDPNTVYSCPALPSSSSSSDSSTLIIDMSGNVAQSVILSLANDAGLCVLSLLDPFGDYLPIARSYDGRDWELSAGPFNSPNFDLNLNCNDDGTDECSIDMASILQAPAGSVGEIRLTSYAPYLDTSSSDSMQQKGIVARFLEQAT